MPKKQKFKVMRVLIYEGDYEFIQRCLNGGVPANGERRFDSGNKNVIKSAIVGGMPDIIDDWEVEKDGKV